jgi:eukaryotic-like serine/threonine-protein kinase
VAEVSPLAPHVVGRYALYDKIASGGMATVHLGRLLGPVGFARTVAIKRLHPHFAEDPDFVSMFLDEARLVARINHPNVVPTIDVVSTGDELFIVMEYVRGESLARLIRAANQSRALIPASTVATILVGVLQGLHAAHEAKNERGYPLGIVHRDISPHNVLVGVDGVPRVLDFGVAKAMGRIQTTREGQLKGKLAYMAPEQIHGETSRATDVYSASIVLWETLTGRRLFAGVNEGQVLERVLKGSQVPPSHYAPGLPRAIDEVTLRGLSFDPATRYATAREMARALEDAVALTSASKIGEWVESVAKSTLDQRSEQIAAIESDSATQAPASLGALRTETRLRANKDDPEDAPPSRPPDTVKIPIVAEEFTQLSSGSVSAAAMRSTSSRRKSALLLTLICGIAAAIVAVFLFLRPSTQSARVAASPSTARAPPATSLPTPSAVASETPATSAAPSETTPAPPPATKSSAPLASTAPLATPPAPTTVARPTPPRRSAPAADPCSPPYYFDAKGVRVFKKECL